MNTFIMVDIGAQRWVSMNVGWSLREGGGEMAGTRWKKVGRQIALIAC
jgi:hypothetical protein